MSVSQSGKQESLSQSTVGAKDWHLRLSSAFCTHYDMCTPASSHAHNIHNNNRWEMNEEYIWCQPLASSGTCTHHTCAHQEGWEVGGGGRGREHCSYRCPGAVQGKEGQCWIWKILRIVMYEKNDINHRGWSLYSCYLFSTFRSLRQKSHLSGTWYSMLPPSLLSASTCVVSIPSWSPSWLKSTDGVLTLLGVTSSMKSTLAGDDHGVLAEDDARRLRD